jgi:hypothetical protein
MLNLTAARKVGRIPLPRAASIAGRSPQLVTVIMAVRAVAAASDGTSWVRTTWHELGAHNVKHGGHATKALRSAQKTDI